MMFAAGCDVEPSSTVPLERVGRRVLVVDDSCIHRQLVMAVLADMDIDLDLACDAFEAKELLKRHPYRLVLTDITMPGLNGNWLLEYIREQNPELPVVALTGSPGLASDDFDRVLSKPYPVHELCGLVLDLLATGRPKR